MALHLQQPQQKKRRDKSQVTCHRCGKKGHYANELEKCQENEKTQVSEVTAVTTHQYEEEEEEEDGDNLKFELCGCNVEGIDLKHGGDGKIPDSWILLDNQSTINVFKNKFLLTNIQKVSTEMKIHCNAGTSTTNMVGDLAGYGTVWYHRLGIANILSLAKVKGEYDVRFVSGARNCF